MVRNKTLLAFPILISAISIFMVILFLTPVAFKPTGYGYGTAQHWTAVGQRISNFVVNHRDVTTPASPDGSRGYSHEESWSANFGGLTPVTLAYFALMYFTSMFLATFLNVAFYREILNALRGQPVSIRSGLRFAASKWKIILMWTLFAGLVGTIIKTLEENFGLVGEWIMRFIGAAWSIACVFVIPVMVTEEETANPFLVLKKSAVTLTRTWGESLIGYVGVSVGGSIITAIPLLWLAAALGVAALLHSLWLGAGAVLGWLVAMIVFGYLMGVASQIFRCALFLYASQGTLPEPYTTDMMNLAWKTKKA
jgi:Family of unknown function (DUF6159)